MITKIQSFTDVITNSSSTVFVMNSFDADYYGDLHHTEGCIDVEKIDMDWLIHHPYECEMVCDLLNVDPSEITNKHTTGFGYSYWEDPDPEAWKSFLALYKDKIEEVFADLYWVEIEDHFEGAYDVIEDAYDNAKWSENRH